MIPLRILRSSIDQWPAHLPLAIGRRKPSHHDEHGAAWVLDLFVPLGGRLVLREGADPERYDVEVMK